MKKQKGFTLIELMVVMAIIAILATAGLTAYSNYLKKARDASRAQIARQLMTAVENLSGGGPVPTVEDFRTFLTTEGFAWTLPTMNPIIGRVSGVIDNALGTTFALPEDYPDLDPLSGKGQCISGFCGFIYVRYSDNTYLIGYGIEHPDSMQNWYQFYNPSTNAPNYTAPVDPVEGLGGFASWYGNFIGTNADTFDTAINTNGLVSMTNLVSAGIVSNYSLYASSL